MGLMKNLAIGRFDRTPGTRRGGGMVRVKSMFFGSESVMRAVDSATRRAMSKFGAFVRRSAKSSLRLARKMTLADMTPEQREIYGPGRDAKGKVTPAAPKWMWPSVSSEPGDPPKLHIRPLSINPLRKLIFFAYDRFEKSVVIGPLRFRTGGAEKLEHGTAGYESRPFMGPAMERERSKLPQLWKNSVKGW